MEINDFKGISYFRFFIPAIFILSWASMIFGPIFANIPYREFCFIIYAYFIVKTIYQTVLTINLVLKGNAALERSKNLQKHVRPAGIPFQEIYHAFAIPSYKQDIQLLAETLEVLAKHERAASTYLIFMAMEEHEQGSDIKAQQLIARFRNKFRNMDFTRHKVREFEQKGKASNVSWCVEHMQEKFKAMMINPEDVFVTVMDADSWAPNAYFNQVQDHLYKNLQNRYQFIYQPTQIYTRNDLQVPIFVRTYDDMYSSFHASSLAVCCGPTFSFSNYTMSFNLVKKVGFWDTVQEAIAEDFHMVLKAHFKTHGQVKTVPIFTPFNQLSIQTGNGYFEDLKAKLWQLQRHGRALTEIGYCTLMFLRKQFTLKTLLTLYVIMDTFLMPIIVPYAVFAIQIQDGLLHWQAPEEGILRPMNFFILLTITNILGVFMNMAYHYYKRKTSAVLYGIEGSSYWRVLQGPILIFLNAVVIVSMTYVISSFSGLKKNRQYVVADKFVSTLASKKVQQSSINVMMNDNLVEGEQQKNQLLTN